MIHSDVLRAYRRGIESGAMNQSASAIVRELLDEVEMLRTVVATGLGKDDSCSPIISECYRWWNAR